jgi:phenylacetate-CoA ligase
MSGAIDPGGDRRPKTGGSVRAKGELVIAMLQKEAPPIVRYRTTSPYSERCACGRTHPRIGRIWPVDMLIVRGINVFPSQWVLADEPEVGNEFR